MIVSNTTPISNLLHIGHISLLFKLFGVVYIPEAVVSEVSVIFSNNDDKDARTIAQMDNLPTIGTLGILLKAKKASLIPSVKQLADRLRIEHHFWIREDMYQKILRIAEEDA